MTSVMGNAYASILQPSFFRNLKKKIKKLFLTHRKIYLKKFQQFLNFIKN